MDIKNLIERLRTDSLYANTASLEIMDLCMDAATAIETLRADLARVTAERDGAIKDIWKAKWISCKHGEGCDFISARTGCPDCAGCGGWEWRGIKEG